MTIHSSERFRRLARRLPWRRHLPPVGAWTFICGLFFATLLLNLEHLPAGDFTGQFHAYAAFQARELAAGRFPLWSPGSNAGFPFVADVQAAGFYPPRFLAIFLSLPWGFSLYVLQLEAIFHVWLAGLFTYALCFNLTASRRAALLGAIAFGLSGYLTSYPLLQPAILETIAWLPLALLFLWRASRATRPVLCLVAAGLALALSALAGHPQTFMHVAYVAGAYLLFQAIRARWSARWVLLAGTTLFLVAAGASAAMWLPALQFAIHSTRTAVSFEFVATGQRLLNYLQIFTPRLLTAWSTEYVGLTTVLLAFYAWFGRRIFDDDAGRLQLPGDRAEIAFWALLAVIAAWLALGEEGIIFRLPYHLAPGFSLFRQQERLLGVVTLSWAVLGAQGFALWLRVGASRRELLRRPAQLALLGLVLCGLFVVASPRTVLLHDGVNWLGQLLIVSVALGLLWWGRGRKVPSVALLFLLGADLFLATNTGELREPGAAADYWQRPSWLERLEADRRPGLRGRLDTNNLFNANAGEVYGFEDIRSISPLQLQVKESIMALPEERRWQLLDVEHVISPTPLSEPAFLLTDVDKPLQPDRQVNAELYRLGMSPGRAWLSYRPLQVAGAEEALAYLARPDFDPASEVILHTPVEGLERIRQPDGNLPVSPGTVAVRRIQANALEIDVDTETDAMLVISEWHYPGWQASLDGSPAALHAANYAFQALIVPPGRHTVILRFFPFVVLAGALLSAFSILTALAVARIWQPVVTLGSQSRRRVPALTLPPLPASVARALDRVSSFASTNRYILLWGTLLLAASLRLFDLGVQELRGDEAFSFLIASRSLADVIPSLLEVADPHPPLHYLLLSAWLRLAGDSEFAMRALPALGSVLLIPLIYRLGKRIWSRGQGLFLALLLTVSHSQVWLSQDVRSHYVLALLFSTLATLLLVRAARQPKAHVWALYTLVAVLAMYSHFYSIFALLAHGLYLLSLPDHGRRLSAWLASGLVALALYLPWLLPSIAGWSRQLSEPAPFNLAPFLMVIVRELLGGPALSDAIGPWIILAAGVLCAVGWLSMWRRQRPWAVLLGSWLAMAMLGVFLMQLRRATFNPFYITVAAPAWWGLIVAGFAHVGRRASGAYSWRRPVAALIVLAVIGLNILALARYWGDPYEYGRSRGYRQLSAYLEANVRDGDVFLANFPDPALTYYLRNIRVAFELQPVQAAPSEAQVEEAMRALTHTYRRLWFAPVHESHWDADDLVFRWLDYHLLLEQRRTFDAVTLEGYRPLDSGEELLSSPASAVSDGVLLDGAYLTVNGLPAAMDNGPVLVPAGAELNVSLVWQAVDRLADNDTVFVHVLDTDGQLVAQHDSVPAHGTRPMDTWRVGERILDEHGMLIPQAVETIEAALVVGLYDSETGQRRRFESGAEQLTLARLAIRSDAPAPTVEDP